MIYLVCINKGQPQSVDEMLRATESFGKRRVLVLDRSPEISGFGWPQVVRNPTGEGFLAGFARDLGAALVGALEPHYTGILFVDGDRIPQEDLRPFCVGDCTLFSTVDDMRGEVPGRLLDCTEWCMDWLNSPFFSCALYLSREVIDRVREDGRLFAECFDGTWGEEDRDLGDRVVAAGFRVMATNAKVSGELVDRYTQGVNPRNFHLRKARHEEWTRTRTTA